MQKEICSGAVVYNNNSLIRFLLLKSKATGYWVFPKGHVKETENLIETAKRELIEETGIKNVEIHKNFCEKIDFVNINGKRKLVYHYLFKSTSDKVRLSEEHLDFEWLTFNKAYQRVDFEDQKRILLLALNAIKNERT